MKAPIPTSSTNTRRAGFFVCVCLLLQQMAMPLHVIAEDHCRVVDGVGAEGVGPTRTASRGTDCRHHHHPHHHHHLHQVSENHRDRDHEGVPAVTDDGGSPPKNRPGHPDPHCPHPVEEHLAEMKGEPARGPSPAPAKAFLLAPIPRPSLPSAPTFAGRAERPENVAPEPWPESPPRSRAPPLL